MNKTSSIQTPSNIPLYYCGPNLDQGPLPTVIYFALSGKESLQLDPYNQPVQPLIKAGIRVLSFTIPAHGPGYNNLEAMRIWAEEIQNGGRSIATFLESMEEDLRFLMQQEFIIPGKLGVMGLSRGGFLATHLAARVEAITHLLGFAPVTTLTYLNEFKSFAGSAIMESLELLPLCPRLIHKNVRFYIGNHDTRVGTDKCFEWISTLAKTAYKERIRSPKVELIISPSIGHRGHGTSPEIFTQGAEWLIKEFS